ncbi:DNA repair exonuclease [Opitutaceae bacterium EW11]|nr:DNA repair exonuclease [Opitutaceae bacterium EW11]
MTARFVHTADWQLGKPFAGVQDVAKRSLLQQERIAVLARIAAVARETAAEFVVVAGDLFDSPHPTKATVAAACSAIGAMKLPVYAIPGNHDHGGPGGLWDQEFFRREASALAPNLRMLLSPEPVETPTAVLFPCPLLRRHEPLDTTGWLRSPEPSWKSRFGDKPRIVIAHGSTQGFGAGGDDEETDDAGDNQIDLLRLPAGAYDYVALGDWHGTKQVGANAWYAGTPEFDRFPKGTDHAPGNVLSVAVSRGKPPEISAVHTRRIGWMTQDFAFADDAGVEQLASVLQRQLGGRAGEDLLRLELTGALGLEAATRLEQLLESYQARLLRLKLMNRTTVAPSAEELAALTQRASDPLISRVASLLAARSGGDSEDAAVARAALRLLHAEVQHA